MNSSLSGTVTAVDTDAGAITVTVAQANRAARVHKGKTVTLNVTATTLLWKRTAGGDLVVVALSDFAAGRPRCRPPPLLRLLSRRLVIARVGLVEQARAREDMTTGPAVCYLSWRCNHPHTAPPGALS